MRDGIGLARLWLAVVGLSLSTVLVAEGQSEGLFAAVDTGSTGPECGVGLDRGVAPNPATSTRAHTRVCGPSWKARRRSS